MKNAEGPYIVAGLVLLSVIMLRVITISDLQSQLSVAQNNYEILEDRVYKLEAHFIGHKILVAHNGHGVDVVPCQLKKDKDCKPESDGIVISNSQFYGWRIGVNDEGNGEKPIEHESSGYLHLSHTDYEGVKGFSYEGPGDWHLKLALWKARIKQFFSRN